jgi:hypothetical protein
MSGFIQATMAAIAGDAAAGSPQAAGPQTTLDTHLVPTSMPASGLVYSDSRQKRDMLPIDCMANGLKLYRYRYRWSPTEYVGVLAQEVAEVVPEAVSKDAVAFLRVDYRRLGLRLRTYQDWLTKGHLAVVPGSPMAGSGFHTAAQ